MTTPAPSENYPRKAQRTLDAARILLLNSDTEGACNRACYAMFNAAHAAHAALWAAGVQEPGAIIKTHAGLVSLFGHELVKTGMIGAEHGRAVGHVHKTRLLADYTSDPPDIVDGEHAIALAEAFVGDMQTFVAKAAP